MNGSGRSAQERGMRVGIRGAEDFDNGRDGVEREFVGREPADIEAFGACGEAASDGFGEDGGVDELADVAVVGIADGAAAGVGEEAEEGGGFDAEAGFLFGFAEGGGEDGFAGIDASAREAPPTAIGAALEDDALVFIEDHDAGAEFDGGVFHGGEIGKHGDGGDVELGEKGGGGGVVGGDADVEKRGRGFEDIDAGGGDEAGENLGFEREAARRDGVDDIS